ncbi:sulfite oxidase heme-binding subunit YedZ [Amphibiibacter pelophylacis]|uniref:Protein-methionine-sulfoxide reductase heme-binding subunit MsrQ n=1 Tax=Amphibiibacter pelophylacis TaxID=1799477 RepID=A0ACC6NYG4_9BURK
MNKVLMHPLAKPVFFVLALVPLALWVYGAFADTLGANPAEAIIWGSGEWTIRFLMMALAVTPLRVTTGWIALARWRRMIGLFSFFYGLIHLLSYSWLDQSLDVSAIIADIGRRPFILVGMLTFTILLVLAITSPRAVVRAMGGARWQALHRTVYAAGLLALLHFFWMRAGKNNFAEVELYAVIIFGLLGWRVWRSWKRRRAAMA